MHNNPPETKLKKSIDLISFFSFLIKSKVFTEADKHHVLDWFGKQYRLVNDNYFNAERLYDLNWYEDKDEILLNFHKLFRQYYPERIDLVLISW